MRLVFAGTPEFAAQALERLLDAGHAVELVLTQPDRPAGRGLREEASAVKRLALARGRHVYQPTTLKSPEVEARLRELRPDAMVVAAYGLLLPPAVLAIPRLGALNIHASLLPRWRGAAPIQRALLSGDRETGVSIMRMDEGLDTGPVYLRLPLAIAADDDAGTLHDKLARLGAQAIVTVLEQLASGHAVLPRPQASAGVTYARKIDKEETWLDWSRTAAELERSVRAFRPAPGARTRLHGDVLKVWRARVSPGTAAPGTVIESGPDILVATAQDALALEQVQAAGGRSMRAAEFLRGRPLAPGTRLG